MNLRKAIYAAVMTGSLCAVAFAQSGVTVKHIQPGTSPIAQAVWAGDKAAEGRLKGLITSPFQQIEAKVVNRLRQVTSAIKQDGANQVSIITSTAERQAAIEFAKAGAMRPEIVGVESAQGSGERDSLVHDQTGVGWSLSQRMKSSVGGWPPAARNRDRHCPRCD